MKNATQTSILQVGAKNDSKLNTNEIGNYGWEVQEDILAAVPGHDLSAMCNHWVISRL
jgi:hypothetical protein